MAYYEARAKGGAGLLVLETSSALWPHGSSMPNTIGFSEDRFIPRLAELTRRVHAHGAKIVAQPNPSGKMAQEDTTAGRPIPAMATEDEQYVLSDGRILGRKAGEALNPTIESRETLYKTLLRINGGAFMSQYQQAPITRRGCGIKWRWNEPKDPSDPESGPTFSMRFGKPSDMAIARREGFGEGLGGGSDGYGEMMPYEEWKARETVSSATEEVSL
jgi:hypothetical protein